MVREIVRRSFALIVLAGLTAGIGAGAWVVSGWVSDRERPSHHIASWVMTKDVYPGGPIAARFILVRHRLCAKRIEFQIEQGPSTFPVTPIVIERGELGLDQLTIERVMPTEVELGEAIFVAQFIWRCNAFHWFRPITMTLRMPIMVKRFNEAALHIVPAAASIERCLVQFASQQKGGE